METRKPLAQRLDDSLLNDDVPLSFESDSSLVRRASYDPGQQVLYVMLIAGKVAKTYAYPGVPPALWLDFSQANSKGQFFSRFIRPMFAGTVQ